MGKPTPLPFLPQKDAAREEEENVHEVYERIAPHFSQTRYKPWPLIESFLLRLPPHAVGLDSGAGNGKYIPVATSSGAEMIAMDRSLGLLEVAKTHGGDCVRGDLCGRGWRNGIFDFAISIAAIHHLSTPDRRRSAVQALIAPLYISSTPPYSRFLIYVWAYEQGKNSKRRMGRVAATPPAPVPGPGDSVTGQTNEQPPAPSEDTQDKVQDVLVPWVLQKPGESSKAQQRRSQAFSHSATPKDEDTPGDAPKGSEPEVFHRYYHLFAASELRSLVEEAAEQEGFELLHLSAPESGDAEAEGRPPGRRKWLRVVGEGWEADNWWIEGEVGIGA